MADDGWVEYQGQRRLGPAGLTVLPSGALLLNRAAYQALGAPDYVAFLVHRQRRALGLRPGRPDEPYVRRVTPQSRGSNYRVSAREVIRHLQLSVEKRAHYPAMLDNGVLVVELPSAGVGDAA